MKEIDDAGCDTALGGTARMFAAEAVGFTKEFGCGHIALFDYDNLVLLKFGLKNTENVGATIIPEMFRKVLLGFLLDASEEAGLSLESV